MTSEREPQGWRTSREGRDGHRAPSARETPWVREGNAARSDTRTAKPASETTTLPPGEKRRRSRGTLPRNKLLENRKINFQESSQQANPARKNPARHRAGERQHPSGRRSRPNPRTGAKRQQGEKKRGQAPHLRRLEYHKTGPARSEDSNVEPTSLQSRTDYQRKAQSHSEGKPDRS